MLGPLSISTLEEASFREKSIAKLGGAETPRIHHSDKQSVTVSEDPLPAGSRCSRWEI